MLSANFPASRGLSRQEEMYSRRDLCQLPTRCLMKPPTRFLVETDRFLKPVPFNVWCACLVRLYADNYWAYSRLWQTGSVGCVAREKNVTGCLRKRQRLRDRERVGSRQRSLSSTLVYFSTWETSASRESANQNAEIFVHILLKEKFPLLHFNVLFILFQKNISLRFNS